MPDTFYHRHWTPIQWWIQGGRPPPLKDQNFLNFMQFFRNFGENYMLAPWLGPWSPPREILDSPLLWVKNSWKMHQNERNWTKRSYSSLHASMQITSYKNHRKISTVEYFSEQRWETKTKHLSSRTFIRTCLWPYQNQHWLCKWLRSLNCHHQTGYDCLEAER